MCKWKYTQEKYKCGCNIGELKKTFEYCKDGNGKWCGKTLEEGNSKVNSNYCSKHAREGKKAEKRITNGTNSTSGKKSKTVKSSKSGTRRR
jgi:hypothetical protein